MDGITVFRVSEMVPMVCWLGEYESPKVKVSYRRHEVRWMTVPSASIPQGWDSMTNEAKAEWIHANGATQKMLDEWLLPSGLRDEVFDDWGADDPEWEHTDDCSRKCEVLDVEAV